MSRQSDLKYLVLAGIVLVATVLIFWQIRYGPPAPLEVPSESYHWVEGTVTEIFVPPPRSIPRHDLDSLGIGVAAEKTDTTVVFREMTVNDTMTVMVLDDISPETVKEICEHLWADSEPCSVVDAIEKTGPLPQFGFPDAYRVFVHAPNPGTEHSYGKTLLFRREGDGWWHGMCGGWFI